ncbi:hypothetical protein AAE478_000381 [Parahypoxylon ruwenzoriense]
MKSIAPCNFDTCPVAASPYGYPPSSAAGALFLIIYIGALIACLIYTFNTKKWLEFSIPVSIACLFEIIGYGVRLGSTPDPWNVTLYATSTAFIIVAPAFVSASIYFTIPETVTILGVEHSLVNVKRYPLLIWIDVLGFVLEVVGIVISFSDLSADTGLGPNARIGSPIIASGIALQALSLICFINLFVFVLFQAAVAYSKFGYTTFHPVHGYVPMAHRFKFFVAMLLLSAMCLFGRALYQVIVLGSGLDSWTAKNQALFAGLDSFLVAEAAVGLIVAHPVIFLRDGVEKRLGGSRNPSFVEERASQYSIDDYRPPTRQDVGPGQSPTNFI